MIPKKETGRSTEASLLTALRDRAWPRPMVAPPGAPVHRTVETWSRCILGVVLMCSVFVIGCNADSRTLRAQDGDTVQVHYTGTLADGTEFDSSRGSQPLEFTLGTGQVIPGFEQAVLGLAIGESRTVTIPAADAYGVPADAGADALPADDAGADALPPAGDAYGVPSDAGG